MEGLQWGMQSRWAGRNAVGALGNLAQGQDLEGGQWRGV